MSRWNQKTTDVKLIANYIPACNEAWGKTDSCTMHTENPLSFSRRLPRNKLYNLTTEVYAPEGSSILPFEEGELKHIECDINTNMDAFSYELKTLEIPGKSLRKAYSNTAVAFTVGLLSVYTWWWMFFRMPYYLAVGTENKNKNKYAKQIPNYNKRHIIMGKDKDRIDAINNVCEFHNNLSEDNYIKKLQLTRNYCLEREKRNPAYKELTQGYRDLLESNLEDSYILKKLPYTSWQALKSFLFNPMGMIPVAEIPKQLINVRNLQDKGALEKYFSD
ncbi:hypothetical protein KAR52_02805 [Candidatus Pacearchaeota archaeon]|nr:hypothetical protein [Candidatus Pacearchaeota archaeon]